jgi:hypothetical protein
VLQTERYIIQKLTHIVRNRGRERQNKTETVGYWYKWGQRYTNRETYTKTGLYTARHTK